MRSGDKAWIALGAGVLAYDLACDEGCTLSESVDSYILERPMLTRVVIFVVAAHLANLLSPRFDVIHLAFVSLRALRRLQRTTDPTYVTP